MNEFEQIVQKLHPLNRLLYTRPLTGGVSAQVTALEVHQPDGQMKKLVVRRYGETDLKHKPHIAADEFRLLHHLKAAGLPVPAPYLFDESGAIFPFPYIVVEYIGGKTDFAPADSDNFFHQMTVQLARIHRIEALPFLPALELGERPAKLDDSIGEGRIRDYLESVWPFPQHNKSVLLHGDFWPGNLLWDNGQLVAVIDWEDAKTGDPLADLANARLEILWAFGSEAMTRFTHSYQSITAIDLTNLPYHDLHVALRPAFKIAEWAAADDAAKTMREKLNWFTGQAFDALTAP